MKKELNEIERLNLLLKQLDLVRQLRENDIKLYGETLSLIEELDKTYYLELKDAVDMRE